MQIRITVMSSIRATTFSATLAAAACGASGEPQAPRGDQRPGASPTPAGGSQSPAPTGAPAAEGAASACSGGLFLPAEDVSIDARKDPAVLRQRAVRIDFSRLDDAEQLTLNLFEDACVVARRDLAVEQKPEVWTGIVEGVPNSSVTLVTASRTVIGSVIVPPRFFQVRLLRDDVHLVNEVDPAKYPKEGIPGGR